MTMKMPSLVAAGVLTAAVAATTQPVRLQEQVRDQTRPVLTGTAVVAGTVVADDETRVPLRRALVTLARAGGEDMRHAPTGDDGTFVFGALPAGTYTLGAAKGGFIAMSYGAPKPGMPGRSIVVGEGERYEAEPIALMRGAVIAGRLVDGSGRPVSGAAVQVSQFVTVGGERRRRLGAGASGSSATNDHGEYRIHGLLPGEYIVYANVSSVAFHSNVTAAEIAWAQQAETARTPAPAAGRPYTRAPTLFPGVANEAAASPIALARGEERTGVDFPLQDVPVARLSGTVTGPDGRSVEGVVIERTVKTRPRFLSAYTEATRSGPDGAFRFNGVSPGDHTLLTLGRPSAAPTASPDMTRAGVTPVTAGPFTHWGLADVSVAGTDVSDVALRMQPGVTVSGQFVLRGSTARPDLTRARVQLMPAEAGAGVPRGLAANADAEGHFRIEGGVPGRYRVTVSAMPAWFLQSAMLGDRDVVDVPLEIRPGGDVAGLTITLVDSQTELSGTLTDAAGRPVSQLYVLVFSADRSHWEFESRRAVSARARDNGGYVIAGLPPGEYYLCALTEVDTTRQASDPSYFEELVQAAIKITLAEGEKRRQDLRVGG